MDIIPTRPLVVAMAIRVMVGIITVRDHIIGIHHPHLLPHIIGNMNCPKGDLLEGDPLEGEIREEVYPNLNPLPHMCMIINTISKRGNGGTGKNPTK